MPGFTKVSVVAVAVVLGSIVAGCGNGPAPSPEPTPTPVETPTLTPQPSPSPSPRPSPTAAPSPLFLPSAEFIMGKTYNWLPDEVTVEFVDVRPYRDKMLALQTKTQGYNLRVEIYNGKIDLKKWWGDSGPLIYDTGYQVNAATKMFVYPSYSFISIAYISRPSQQGEPKHLKISRSLSVETPAIPSDESQTFVTEFWSFPDDIGSKLVNPAQFNDNMNREYRALKELLGRDSDALGSDGHLRLVVAPIAPYCGLAGNPIQMDPVCMDPAILNTGNPGWGPAHELGHLFVGPYSYCWGETDSNEGWANFMAFYAYDNKIFANSDYDAAFWANVWDSSPKKTDILQGLIVKLSHEHGWGVARTFFRKYLSADPAQGKSDTVKMKQAVTYLAQSAREVTGLQSTYDYVVSYLVGKGFPQP